MAKETIVGIDKIEKVLFRDDISQSDYELEEE